MNNYPIYAKVKNTKYKINSDYRIALKCNDISQKNDISDEERAIAIIYLLFGEKGLTDVDNWNELIQISLKYLNCGKKSEKNETKNKEVNMDFNQDWSYIQASFFSDYNIDLTKTDMHWWQFYELLCGLTDECVLNRVRFVRDFDLNSIKDRKEKEKWAKQKEQVALRKQEENKTLKQRKLDELFEKQLKKGE